MNFKKQLNKLGYNLAYWYNRMRLTNRDFTIISNDCSASLIYNLLRLRKDTPTCDMVIVVSKYIDFCKHLKEYLSLPVDEPTDEDLKSYSGCKVPLGMLHGNGKLPDIGLVFTHYDTLENARESWYRRRERVHYDNLFFILDCGAGSKEQILDEFEKLPYRNKIAFTDLNDKTRWKSTFTYSYFKGDNPKKLNHFSTVRRGPFLFRGIDEFDYVKWLNNGKNRTS